MGREQIELSYIIPVFYNQKDSQSLTDLLEHYSKYDQSILQRIQFIIVDDHSTVPITVPGHINVNYRIFRIKNDIQWNQSGARNLGATYAYSSKIILTDSDHHFPEILFRKILNSSTPKRTLYTFKRTNTDGTPKNSHVNTFYTTKAIFFAALGYDEEFCGHYGYENIIFRYLEKRIGNRLRYFNRKDKIISIKVDRTNSYHDFVRDTNRNKELMDKKMKFLKTKNPFLCHSRLFLNFDYEKVCEHWI